MSFQNVVDSVLKPAGVKVGGYPDDIFLELGDDERERWQCSICYLVSRQAKECDNGHLFCTTCVFAWSMTYGANSDKCPVCRSKQAEYRPRAEVDESIGRKRVRCPEPACSFRAPLTYLLKHSHGAERFGMGSVDLESLRRSRPAPVNPFLAAGSGVIFLPLLRAPAGASGASREGRSLLQDMMMVLHLEMELRRRAIERFSSEEDHIERVRHMTEVLAIQEQMQEITGFLNLLFSVTPQQRRSDPVGQDNRQTEHRGAPDVAESDDDDVDDGDDSSSDSDETSLTAVLSSRETATIAGPGLTVRRQPELPSYPSGTHLPSPAHVLAPMPPAVPRHAAAAAATPRGRWRVDDGAEASPSNRWPTSGDAGAGGTPAASQATSSLGMSRNVRLPSPQPPPNAQAAVALQAVPLVRPALVPHPPLMPPPSFAAGERPESSIASGTTATADDVPASGAATTAAPSSLSLPRRTPRLDEGRSGDATVLTGLAPSGSATFQAAMRQLPPIGRAVVSHSPSPRPSEFPAADLVPVPPPPRERTIFATRSDATAASEPVATPAAAGDNGLGLSRGVRRVVRRRKVAHGPPDIVPPRREPEPAASGPVTRSRSQLGNAAAAASRNGAVATGANQPGGEQRPRLSRTRGIDLMLRTRDSSSQRQ